MEILSIDHLVLTVKDIEKTIQFYESVLRMKVVRFGEGRVALKFGNQKINLHEKGKEFEPKANQPTPGSADLCFLTTMEIEKAMSFIQQQGVDIVEGPVDRTGATGHLVSIYLRDPDKNLIEISNIK
jgi:catechol 2,3-dioxygenase-like lactoylglutathione lyase family enzyme